MEKLRRSTDGSFPEYLVGRRMQSQEEKQKNWRTLLNTYIENVSEHQVHLLRDRIQRLEARKTSMEQSIANYPTRIDKASLLIENEDTDRLLKELTEKLHRYESHF